MVERMSGTFLKKAATKVLSGRHMAENGSIIGFSLSKTKTVQSRNDLNETINLQGGNQKHGKQ